MGAPATQLCLVIVLNMFLTGVIFNHRVGTLGLLALPAVKNGSFNGNNWMESFAQFRLSLKPLFPAVLIVPNLPIIRSR